MVLENTSIVNNGAFTNAPFAQVSITGTGDRFIQGSGNTQFYALYMNKAANNLLLQSNIKVSGNLVFTKGSIDLGTNSMQLIYPNGFIQSETDANRIFSTGNGVVFIEQPLNAPTNVNPGNLGFIINSQNNLGATTIYRGHDRQSKGSGDLSIQRHYNVVPTNNQNIYASYEFGYLDAELSGMQENSLKPHQKIGAADWQPVMASGYNTSLNFISVSGATSLNRYTAYAAAQAPLPLTLLAFDVQCKNNSIQLQWITANEVNTKGFTVEKSTNGSNWEPAGFVPAKGNSAQEVYTTILSTSNATLYRLKMEDKDGSFTYSLIRKLECSGKNSITIGPNPTSGQLTISIQSEKKDNVSLVVMDVKGRLVYNKTFSLNEGLNVQQVDISNAASGVYIVSLTSPNGINETHRIVKK